MRYNMLNQHERQQVKTATRKGTLTSTPAHELQQAEPACKVVSKTAISKSTLSSTP
jgi:hypothetical protein